MDFLDGAALKREEPNPEGSGSYAEAASNCEIPGPVPVYLSLRGNPEFTVAPNPSY